MLFRFKKTFLSLHLGTYLKEELTAYCFIVLEASGVFLIPTQAEWTGDSEHFAND